MHMDLQTHRLFIPVTFAALIRKLRTFILHLRELRRLSAFRPQLDLPLTRQHTELGPFRPGTHGTQMLDIATDQFPSAKHESDRTLPDSDLKDCIH
jgi:hypothetical protein